MKIECSRQKLVEALSNVQRAVAVRSSIAALEGIKVTACNKSLELLGYNTEIAMKTSINAEIIEEGSIVLGARLLTEITRKLPEEQVLLHTNENLSTIIKSGVSEFSLTGINPDEFPELPSINDPQIIDIEPSVLKSMIKQTIFATAETDAKPIHTGTLFDIKNKYITLVSVDGYRLALRKEKIEEDIDLNFVVPGKTLSEVLKLIRDDEEEKIKISADNRHIVFDMKNYKIISRLLEGEFLDYKATIPETYTTRLLTSTRTMLESVERVSLLITERLKSPVKCTVGESKIKLSCMTPIGHAKDEIYSVVEGQELEIGFNSKYMMDALKNTDTDEIELNLNGPLSPIKIMPKQSDAFLFLVLPVRMKSE